MVQSSDTYLFMPLSSRSQIWTKALASLAASPNSSYSPCLAPLEDNSGFTHVALGFSSPIGPHKSTNQLSYYESLIHKRLLMQTTYQVFHSGKCGNMFLLIVFLCFSPLHPQSYPKPSAHARIPGKSQSTTGQYIHPTCTSPMCWFEMIWAYLKLFEAHGVPAGNRFSPKGSTCRGAHKEILAPSEIHPHALKWLILGAFAAPQYVVSWFDWKIEKCWKSTQAPKSSVLVVSHHSLIYLTH